MEIKFIKNIHDYKYIIMFDLASHNTGVCLWNIEKKCPEETFTICVNENNNGDKVLSLFNKLNEFLELLKSKNINKKDILFYKEAMPPQLRGGSSTVQTFISLARSHAILDLFINMNELDICDYTGIYPITTHAYLKKLKGFDREHKVVKQDIKEYCIERFGVLDNLTYDEYDAIFLALTFVDIKWNKDIDEKIKEVKKHSKTLKSEKGKNDCLQEIDRLEGLKI